MYNAIIMIGAVVAFVFVWRSRSQLVSSGVVSDSLTGNEKLYVWLLSLLSPILAGAIFYYGWKKVAPQKAKSANRISFLALLILVVVFYGMIYLFKFNPLSLPTFGETSSNVSNEQAQPYENAELGISIVPPLGWQRITGDTNPNLIVSYGLQDKTSGNIVANISILGEQIDSGVTPDSYFTNLQKLLSGQYENGKLSATGKIGTEPPTYQLTLSYPSASGQSVIAKYLIKISGGNSFMVQARSTEAGWQKYGVEIENSLSTFSVK